MVAIKGMEMPSCCRKCEYTPPDCSYCLRLHQVIPRDIFNTSRLSNCPLVQIEKRKVGKLIAIDNTHSQRSECGVTFSITSSDEWEVSYCPNCGSRNER